jgi:hypothetical protein
VSPEFLHKFSISIYFLVPFIFGLFSILTSLVSFQVIDYGRIPIFPVLKNLSFEAIEAMV